MIAVGFVQDVDFAWEMWGMYDYLPPDWWLCLR